MKKKLLLVAVISLFSTVFVLAVLFTIGEVVISHSSVTSINSNMLQQSGMVTQIPVSPTKNASSPDKPSESAENVKKLTITAVGDILLGRGVEYTLKKNNKTYKYPFEEVVDILKKGDVVFGNLEESITSSNKSLTDIKNGGKYVLKNEEEAFNGIEYAGFNLLSLANNHILDYYDKGLFDTISILDAHKIAHSGAGKDLTEARRPAIVEKNGIKMALLSYTDMANVVYKGNPPLSFCAAKDKPGVSPRNFDYVKEDIEKVRKDVDIVAVSLHWGIEYCSDITPEQIDFAHKVIDSGADIIIGHHSHRLKGIEIYKGKPVIYSLGNFIFDQDDPDNQESLILNIGYSGSLICDFRALPIRTINKCRIVPLKGNDASKLLNKEMSLSRSLNSKCHIEGDNLVFEF